MDGAIAVARRTPGTLSVAAVEASTVRPLAFFWTLVRTDFKVRYHGTLAGFVWALLKPLAMFLVLAAVFSLVFADQPDYRANLIVGLFLWDFFAEGTKVGLASLHAKSYLLAKARFPTWLVVLASLANAVVTLVVVSLLMLAFLWLTGRPPTAEGVALFAAYQLAGVAIVFGISLATSVLFLRYRDLNQVWDLVTQAGFFVAPIVYPLGIIPWVYHRWLYLWPPTPIIQFSRQVLVTGPLPTARAHLFLAIGTALILLAGILVHRRHGPRAAEYL